MGSRKTRRQYLRSATAGASALALTGCLGSGGTGSNGEGTSANSSGTVGSASSSSNNGGQTLFLGSVYSSGHVVNKMANRWAKSVAKKTDGRIKINIEASFGGESEVAEQTQFGGIDGNVMGTGWVFLYTPELFWFESPFVLNGGWEQLKRAYTETKYGKTIVENCRKEAEQIPLGKPVYRGTRHVTSNNTIARPENLKGVSMRLPEIDSWVTIWEELGANPSTVAYNELYSALQQGVVDAQENPVETAVSLSMWEVQDYLNLTGSGITTGWVLMGLNAWEKFSEDDQKLLENTLVTEIESTNKSQQEREDTLIKELGNKGMEIVEVNQEPWLKSSEPVLQSLFENEWEGSLQEARSI